MLAIGRKRGFTFIELLFVIIIIGILIGVSLPRFKKTFESMQLDAVSGELQAVMNYLCQRATVEGKIIYLNIDNDKKEYWAQVKEATARIKTYHIPQEISIETEQEKIAFYPNGNIDKITIKVVNVNGQAANLTTKGVYSGAKLQRQN